MDAKLKSLKVVDLKQILANANISVPAKSNKADLIARIIANPAALRLYHALNDPLPTHQNDDLLAPPEDVDWNTDDSPSKPGLQVDPSPPSPAKPKPVALVPVDTPAPLPPPPPTSAVDADLEKRKLRAARFGIPLVEPKQPRPTAKSSAVDDPEKLNSRAARFGTSATGLKRAAPVEKVDSEEAEKRRKRAERFSMQ